MFCDKVKTSITPSLSSFNPNCIVVLKLIDQLEKKKKKEEENSELGVSISYVLCSGSSFISF